MSFVYIEGDDAEIVAYHALGRNSQLQPVYSSYQSMMDAVLSLLPPKEDIVRIAAMTLTAIAAPMLFLLIMLLAFDWCWGIVPQARWPIVTTMLFVVPEFYYLAMVLTPSVTAMSLLVAAHLVLRRSTARTQTPNWLGFSASVLLFGIGAAFRWDTVTYGATIATDLFFRASDRSEDEKSSIWYRLWMTIWWGTLAGTTWLIALNLNGYTLDYIIRTIRTQGPVEPLDLKMGLSRIHTLFTPALAVLSVAGLYLLLRRKHPLAFVTLVSIVPVARLLLYGVPKWMITLTPTLIACALVALSVFWRRPWQRYMILTLTILPWLIGVRMTYSGAAWGPGFEVQKYDRIPKKTSWPSLILGSGTAVPTPEGPRALFGHAWVFSGDWKQFVVAYWSEQERAVRKSIETHVPLLLQDSSQGWGVVAYSALGYRTVDPHNRSIDHNFVIERSWYRPDGPPSRMLQLVDPKQIFVPSATERLRQVAGSTVIIAGYPSTLGKLYKIAPHSLEPLGKVTAVLHLDQLSASLRGGE
jgi:hypothetical protein